jgi:peptide-methionine (S)-S-oxide reductase
MTKEKVIFGAGCFWGVEAAFRKINGAAKTTCGYTGGHTDNPTYSDVCSGSTGHIEVVQVEYDPREINFKTLLDTFWHCHNPTTQDQQGADIGPQYRSAIFFITPEQKSAAEVSKNEQNQSGYWKDPIVTNILPANKFYPAEEYHQCYFEKHGIG